MLFAALLAFVGVAKAQLWLQPTVSTETETYEYYIVNYRNQAYSVTTTTGLAGGAQQLGSANAFDGTKAKVAFKLVEGGKLWSTNTATPLILGYTTIGEAGNSVQLFAEDSQEGYTWKIEESANGGHTLSAGTSNNSWNMHGGAGANIGLYRKSDGGSNWVFVPANEAAMAKAAEAKAENAISTEYYYQIKNLAHSRMLAANATNATSISRNSTADLNQLWAFEQAEDGAFYLRNAGQEKYLVAATENSTAWTVGAEGTAFEVEILNFSKKNWTIHAVGQDGYGCAHDANWGRDAQVVRWEAPAGASQWYLEKTDISAKAKEISFTYSLKYNGVDKGTQECTTLTGAAYPDVTDLPYGIKAAIPTGEVTEEVAGTTITVELSDDLPFTYAANYESIENWYYLNIRDDGPTYMYYDKDVAFIKATEKSVPADSKNAYTWAFIGDPFTGFSIVNYEAGSTMVLSAPEAPSGSQNAKQLARMVVEDTIEGGNKTWNFVKPTHANAAAGAFYVQHPTSTLYAFNRQDYSYNGVKIKTVCYWTGRDTGSALQVVKRDDYKELTDLVAVAEDMGVKTDGVGTFTEETVEKFNAALTAAKSVGTGDFDAIGQATVDLQAAINGLATIQPEADKFYTIVSSCTKDHRAGQEIYVNKDGVMHFAKEVDVNYASAIERVFQFVPTNDGKFYLFNIEKGTYMQSVGTATELDVTKAKAVTIKNMGKDNIVSIVPDGQNQMHAQDRNSIIVGWHNDSYNDGSAWTIVETELSLNDLTHTLTVSDAGWATLVLGYNTTIPTGVKAYAVSSIAEGKAVLTEVTEVLPAHTPVLIEAAKGEYAFNYTATEATVASNLLAGSVFNTYVAPVEGTTNYVLSNNNSVVALYKKTKTNADGKIEFGANKAYLPVVTAAEGAPAMFAFGRDAEEGTTGIDQFISNEEVVIYDLAGRRVQKMEKGIYIVNGKKVVIK